MVWSAPLALGGGRAMAPRSFNFPGIRDYPAGAVASTALAADLRRDEPDDRDDDKDEQGADPTCRP